jgi:hypothetical protein
MNERQSTHRTSDPPARYNADMARTATKGEKSLASLTFLVSLVALVAAAPVSGLTAAWLQTASSSSAWSEPAAPAIAPSYPETRDRVSGKSGPARDRLSSELSRDLRQGYEQSCGWEAVGSLDAPGGGAQAAIRERVMANIARSRSAREASNFAGHVRRVEATSTFQALVGRANARLARNPSLFADVLSEDELIASASHAGLARANWGNVVERLAADEIVSSPQLRGLFRHVGGAGNPDFIGLGRYGGLNFDATTVRQITTHMNRPGYGHNLIIGTYSRPGWFPLR